MHSELSVAVLGVPAMLVAGLASSAHCALMCGLLHAGAARGRPWPMQAGRLTAYALLGALAGWAGGWLLRVGHWLPAAETLRIVALPLMLALVLWRPLHAKSAACCEGPSSRRANRGTALAGFAAGLGAGLTPCVLLYAAAAYAAMSGSAGQGAMLLLAFGLGTVPAVQAGAWIWTRFTAASAPTLVRRTAIVVAIGSVVLMAAGLVGHGGADAWWCLPVRSN